MSPEEWGSNLHKDGTNINVGGPEGAKGGADGSDKQCEHKIMSSNITKTSYEQNKNNIKTQLQVDDIDFKGQQRFGTDNETSLIPQEDRNNYTIFSGHIKRAFRTLFKENSSDATVAAMDRVLNRKLLDKWTLELYKKMVPVVKNTCEKARQFSHAEAKGLSKEEICEACGLSKNEKVTKIRYSRSEIARAKERKQLTKQVNELKAKTYKRSEEKTTWYSSNNLHKRRNSDTKRGHSYEQHKFPYSPLVIDIEQPLDNEQRKKPPIPSVYDPEDGVDHKQLAQREL